MKLWFHRPIRVGDPVRVKDGGFRGFTGQVCAVYQDRRQVAFPTAGPDHDGRVWFVSTQLERTAR